MGQRHLQVVGCGSAAGPGAAAPAPGCPVCGPDLVAIRALAECSELASAVSGLTGTPTSIRESQPKLSTARVPAQDAHTATSRRQPAVPAPASTKTRARCPHAQRPTRTAVTRWRA